MNKLLFTVLSLGMFSVLNAGSYETLPSSNLFQNRSAEPFSAATDNVIKTQINDILNSGMLSGDMDTVTFDVSNGMVSIKGTVPTAQDRTLLEDAIKSIAGVKALDSSLQVQDNDTASTTFTFAVGQDTATSAADKELNAKIRDSAGDSQFWSRYKNVTFNTSNGIVILEGTVPSEAAQQDLINAISGIDGVTKVVSNLSFTTAQ